MKLRDINFARLNHVLIPETKAGRDRARRSIPGRILLPAFWFASALTREGRAFVGLLFLVGAAGLDVGQSQVHLLFVFGVGAVVGSFVVRPLFRLRDAVVSIAAPARVIENEPVTFGVEVVNRSRTPIGPLRIEGPFLPWDGRWERGNGTVAELEVDDRVRVELRARFLARGEHHLDPFTVSRLTPLALVQGRSVPSADVRFVVLPRPARVVSLTLPPVARNDDRSVRHHERPGDAELATVRPYRPGDPLRRLSARTWARTGTPHVKEFLDEATTELWVVFEASGASEKLFEAALRLMAGVVVHLGRAGIRIAGIVAGGRAIGLPRDPVAAEGVALDVLASVPYRRTAPDPRAFEAMLARAHAAVSVSARGARHEDALRSRPGSVRALTVVDDGTASGDAVARAVVEQGGSIAL